MISEKELKELTMNIVNFKSWNTCSGPVCGVLFGDKIKIHTFSLEGEEEKVLELMKKRFWSFDSIHLN